jgi:hypothetical protein
MDTERYVRQQGIVLPEELPAVTVVGAGGIGSFTVLALAKMGVTTITVYDPDTVEEHNIPNQLYRQAHLTSPKVNALHVEVKAFTDVVIEKKPKLYEGEGVSGVLISAVDSMASRKEIWSKVKYRPAVPLYIEARMGAEVSRIHTLNPCDPEAIEWYEGTLYSDEEALPDPCTARAIIYNGFAIAALIANQVKKFSKREQLMKEIIFDLKTLTLMTQ